MQALTADEERVLNRIREAKKKQTWGTVSVELQGGKVVAVETKEREKIES